MSTLYIITNTLGDDIFSIKPGGLNGPGGTLADTDLRLYGQGATAYGEGVNENLYRLAESFACPEKGTGDYNPATELNDFDPTTDPVTPQDEHDLGPNNGINNPLNGQPWFNTTRNKLMTFVEGGGFQFTNAPTSSPTEPESPSEGDLWYDTSIPQLKVYGGAGSPLSFISVADRYLQHDGTVAMTGNLNLGTNKIINVVDPINPQEAATMNYVDTEIDRILAPGYELDVRYVEVLGDTMTGDLTFGGGAQILSDTGSVAAPSVSFVSDPNTGMYSGGANILDFGTGGTLRLRIETNGTLSVIGTTNYETLVTADDDIPNKKYVDDEVSAASATADAAPEIFTSLSASSKAGDIATFAGEIWMATGVNVWKQIYPAIYS